LEMLKKGRNPNRFVGNMNGHESAIIDESFDMVDNASITLLPNREEVRDTIAESNRVLKPEGLLSLTIDSRQFTKEFRHALKQMGFEVISGHHEGFAVSRGFRNRIREQLGETFAAAYERKLSNTRYLLARKVGKPEEDVDVSAFDFPTLIPEEERQREEEAAKVIDPRESRNIITPRSGGRRRGGRARPRVIDPTVASPELIVKTDSNGVVISAERVGKDTTKKKTTKKKARNRKSARKKVKKGDE
jgi:SAM-dependent methyltransferase